MFYRYRDGLSFSIISYSSYDLIILTGIIVSMASTLMWGKLSSFWDNKKIIFYCALTITFGFCLNFFLDMTIAASLTMLRLVNFMMFAVCSAGINIVSLLYSIKEANESIIVSGVWLFANALGVSTTKIYLAIDADEIFSLIINSLFLILAIMLGFIKWREWYQNKKKNAVAGAAFIVDERY